jgi:hypothetical protein
VKKPMVSPFGAASPSWLLPMMPPAPLTFLMTTVGLPRSAGRIVDDHGDGLALVELGKRDLRDGGGDERGEGGREQNSSRHSSTSRTRPSLAAPPAARSQDRRDERYGKDGGMSSARGGGGYHRRKQRRRARTMAVPGRAGGARLTPSASLSANEVLWSRQRGRSFFDTAARNGVWAAVSATIRHARHRLMS